MSTDQEAMYGIPIQEIRFRVNALRRRLDALDNIKFGLALEAAMKIAKFTWHYTTKDFLRAIPPDCADKLPAMEATIVVEDNIEWLAWAMKHPEKSLDASRGFTAYFRKAENGKWHCSFGGHTKLKKLNLSTLPS